MDVHDQRILHSSIESNWLTPDPCFQCLDREFRFAIDLAADRESRKTDLWLGPGSRDGENALEVSWAAGRWNSVGFINPPFSKTLMNAYNTGRIKVDGVWQEHEKDRAKAKTFDIGEWAKKCWQEAQLGMTVVGIFPFAPQTDWYREYINGHVQGEIVDGHYPIVWNGFAAREERRLPHRISFLKPDGTPAGNAGVNSVIVVWRPNIGIVGPWQPHSFYWTYRS